MFEYYSLLYDVLMFLRSYDWLLFCFLFISSIGLFSLLVFLFSFFTNKFTNETKCYTNYFLLLLVTIIDFCLRKKYQNLWIIFKCFILFRSKFLNHLNFYLLISIRNLSYLLKSTRPFFMIKHMKMFLSTVQAMLIFKLLQLLL